MISPWIAWSFTDLFSSRRYPRMTAKQQAAYLALLGEQATNGPLPLDEDELAFLACRHTVDLDPADWAEVWRPPLTQCFEERDGGLVNPRMADEVAAAEARSSKASKASRARWGKRKQCANIPSPEPEQSASNARTGQDRIGQDRRVQGAGGDTPPAAPPVPGKTEGERLYNLAVVECPRGRLARQDAQGATSWAFEWDSTGYPFELGKRALARYRASGGGSTMPAARDLAGWAHDTVRLLMPEVRPLRDVVDHLGPDDGMTREVLGQLFPAWGEVGWNPDDHDAAWREAQAIARVVREERA